MLNFYTYNRPFGVKLYVIAFLFDNQLSFSGSKYRLFMASYAHFHTYEIVMPLGVGEDRSLREGY